MEATMFKFIEISKSEAKNIRLQEHLSDCLRCLIRDKVKQATVQSVLYKQRNNKKVIVVVYIKL